jgi:hypothetical protein
MSKKTVIFLKTIRTASTNNLCILRRLAVENFIEKTYCIAEVDDLNSLLENLYISNQHSPASRAKAVLDKLDPQIWKHSLKVATVRNPWDQAVSAFWRTFVITSFFKLSTKKAPKKIACAIDADKETRACVKVAQALFNNSLETIRKALATYPPLDIPPQAVEKGEDPEVDQLSRDLLFSLQRTLNVLMIKRDFVADFYIKYESMAKDWNSLLAILGIDKNLLRQKHQNEPKRPIKNDLGNSVPRAWGCFNLFLLENEAIQKNKKLKHSYVGWYKNSTEEVVSHLMAPVINQFNYNFIFENNS